MFVTPGFFMLRAGEERTSLDCGCTLINTINTVFAYCPLHESASDLLEALEQLETVTRSYLRYPLEGEEPGYDAKDVLAYCIEARAAVIEANKKKYTL